MMLLTLVLTGYNPEWSQCLGYFIYQGAGIMAHDSHTPALSVVGLCLPGPLSCSWLSNMHPLTLNVILLPTQTGLFVCAETEGT